MNSFTICQIPILTSNLWLLPFIYIYIRKPNNISTGFFVLLALVVLTILSSYLFWYNPVKNSIYHKIDAIMARTAIVSFLLYNKWYRGPTILFTASAICSLVFFGLSHYQYLNEQCSHLHVFSHTMAHIFAAFAILFTFI